MKRLKLNHPKTVIKRLRLRFKRLSKPAKIFNVLSLVFVLMVIASLSLGIALHLDADRSTVKNPQSVAASQPKATAPTNSATTSPKPAKSTPAAPTSSSSTGSNDAGETQFTQTEIQATNQENCTDYHSNTLYSYQTDVNNLASQLGSNEDEDYTQFTQSDGIETFTTLINAVNYDISSTNSTISSDWNINFVTSKPPVDCGITPSVPLLQVPSCEATDAGDISTCISQIDTSLDID